MYYIYIDKKTNRIIDVKNKIVGHSDNLIVCEVETLPEKYDYLEVLNLREETETYKIIQEDYDDNGEIVAKEVEKSRTYFTCDLKACFYPQPTAEELERQNAIKRISELKKLLSETDYQAIKYAEGWLTDEEYAPIKAQRQVYRNEINVLENQ